MRPAETVAVVGGGIAGLAVAWFLRARGVAITVYERDRVGAGASWGNAGWLTPPFAVPLPSPATLRAGLSGLLSRYAPLSVPAPTRPGTLRFLTALARHCTESRWQASMAAVAELNRRALAAHDRLVPGEPGSDSGNGTEPATSALVALRSPAERETILAELARVRAAGQPVEFEVVDGRAARHRHPLLTPAVTAAVVLHRQRFVEPGRYLDSLAGNLRRAGGTIATGVEVRAVHDTGTGVRLLTSCGTAHADAAVLAGGAELGALARPFGVRMPVHAGRGYSFSVACEHLPRTPVYFPGSKLVFTPMGDRLRVAGLMEFQAPDAPLDRRRVAGMVRAARPLVGDIDWSGRIEEWVGSRPCTADGLPLAGPTRSARVFVAGGAGMWGMTHGPVTGELLAETVASGTPQPELAPFHPLR
ncbi:FAD-dependent oxidoreductase [Haloechinothrix sp. LS1_15]|uniref:NAD(P)/FAD-dependent oxidoreductase n=1 Tax=Haloechinothrix sp. LS1_15 TaxID=2652248 RepID=UPI002947C318|nr:FAD-dependent oxidoreductase [Haloechinothrix sp. LS1_15]MDV6014052.1 FAD-binding oxidoreductase [Haloechinothrix sp. LS1_15]